MTIERKNKIHALLKGIETGDPASVAVVNPHKYIQHNPQTQEGGEGLAELFKRLSKTSPRVNIVRLFSDGDFVFGHTEYDFSSSRIGFEIFRFEGEQTVEHWDNIQSRQGPNASRRSMVDGPTQALDLDKTECNRAVVKRFVQTVLIDKQLEQLDTFVSSSYAEHSPDLADGTQNLKEALTRIDTNKRPSIEYQHLHRVLAEGDFVLAVSEGYRQGQHSSFYDLFRLEDTKVVEHWDTVEKIAPRSEWKNENGKF